MYNEFDYTNAVILYFLKFFFGPLTLSFQHKYVWIFRDCLCIKTSSTGTVIFKHFFTVYEEEKVLWRWYYMINIL